VLDRDNYPLKIKLAPLTTPPSEALLNREVREEREVIILQLCDLGVLGG
jgi:hypothetical protein